MSENEKPVFRVPPVFGDERVTPVMTKCIGCGAELPETKTANDGKNMALFVQCQQCNRVYMLDFSGFGQ